LKNKSKLEEKLKNYKNDAIFFYKFFDFFRKKSNVLPKKGKMSKNLSKIIAD